MHCVRVALFHLKPGMMEKYKEVTRIMAPKIQSRPGFRRVTFFTDEATDECGAFVEWETEADAHAAASDLEPKAAEMMADFVTKPPYFHQFVAYKTEE